MCGGDALLVVVDDCSDSRWSQDHLRRTTSATQHVVMGQKYDGECFVALTGFRVRSDLDVDDLLHLRSVKSQGSDLAETVGEIGIRGRAVASLPSSRRGSRDDLVVDNRAVAEP